MGAQDIDVVIVGAGPAGIFCALALVECGFAGSIVMLDKGLAVEDRVCPKQAGGPCAGCDPCRITTGFSGAGAFSDGKLSLSSEVGGDLPDLIGHEAVQAAIGEVDGVYLAFGADGRVEGAGPRPEVDGIRLSAIEAGLKLVDCPLRHLGTERARELYARLERHLADAGVDLRFRTTCTQVLVEGDACTGVVAEGPEGAYELRARHTVVATGRRGADWLERMCREHRIAHGPGPVDIGVRVEVRNEVMRTVNDVLYESKLIGYPKPFKNKVRTFCQNPGGFVSQENYDGGLAVVNGHSYKERKSANTNLAILCSHNFSEPFDQPIAYAQKVGELTNMLGDGRIRVQRLGDILDGKRTWDKELRRSNVAPTLGDAVAGDITAAMPYRAMTNILAFMLAVDKVVPGFAAPETLLYSPELKFYSNRVKMDEGFRTSIRGLRCLGDSSGWTRGLMMASVMGYLAGGLLADV